MVVECTLGDYNFYQDCMQGVYTLYTLYTTYSGEAEYIHTKTN